MNGLLFPSLGDVRSFPPTRYQGSKRKLLGWIAEVLRPLAFDSALDLFGGTGAVAYLLKTMGKEVTYNDALRANALVGRALVENAGTRLGADDLEALLAPQPGVVYGDFVARTFRDIYFLPEEDRWLDVVAGNLARVSDPHAQALAYYGLFQACLVKRPYNLFHRANLYLRTADVPRSFGNKVTWDRPFPDHVREAVAAANGAVFDNGRRNRALHGDALAVEGCFDLVYIDPPYVSGRGVGTDYLDFYHFLEGLSEYERWPSQVTLRRKHRPYARRPSPWTSPDTVADAFDAVFARYRDSILVVSYRADGIPTPDDLLALLRRHRPRVRLAAGRDHQYALSRSRSRELLFVAE